MRGRKKLVPLVIVTCLTWLFAAWLTWRFGPEAFIRIMNYELGIMYFAFPLIFLASSLTFALIFNNTRRGILLGLGVTIFLALRLLKLTHPLYLIIIIGLMIALEFSFRKR